MLFSYRFIWLLSFPQITQHLLYLSLSHSSLYATCREGEVGAKEDDIKKHGRSSNIFFFL
jgi:hypothetical protein